MNRAESPLILVVEDNEVNQKVIGQQLQALGYRWEMAADGQQGLEKWCDGRFALILCDCQMPVMDGFQMTEAIRAAEQVDHRDAVPIIAITANTSTEAQRQCRDVGMDDYLAKPVDLRDLSAILRRWLGGPGGATDGQATAASTAASVPAPAMPPRSGGAAVDLEVLKRIFGQEDRPLFVQIMEAFVTSAEQDMLRLDQAFASGDVETIMRVTHKLKSSAKMVGAADFGALCEYTEREGKAGRAIDVAVIGPEMRARFELARDFVNGYLHAA